MYGNSQFDGNAAFSGGGFMSSQTTQTADPSFSPAKNRDAQGLLPVVRQVEKLGDDVAVDEEMTEPTVAEVDKGKVVVDNGAEPVEQAVKRKRSKRKTTATKGSGPLNCNDNHTMTHKKDVIAGNDVVCEEDKSIKIFQKGKRLKRIQPCDLPTNDLEITKEDAAGSSSHSVTSKGGVNAEMSTCENVPVPVSGEKKRGDKLASIP